MHKQRLLRLANRMAKVKPKFFDIESFSSFKLTHKGGEWNQEKGQYDPSIFIIPEGTITKPVKEGEHVVLVREGFCNSTACVLGQGALIREFNDDGLFLDIAPKRYEDYYQPVVTYLTPDGETFRFSEAGQKFFDLTTEQAHLLFFTGGGLGQDMTVRFYMNVRADNNNYTCSDNDKISPQRVASALRRFVESDGKSAEPYIMMNYYEGESRWGSITR